VLKKRGHRVVEWFDVGQCYVPGLTSVTVDC